MPSENRLTQITEDGKSIKLYILHDNSDWMKAWRPTLNSHFGANGYEEWLLDGTGDNESFSLSFDFRTPPPEGVFFCKGSGSAHMRGLPHARDSFTAVLQWLEYHGRLVVNGERAFATETSKVSQLVAMSNFGLEFAKTTAIFGTGNLVQGAETFLATLDKGEGFWIRFNRAGSAEESCGRGLCLCYSIADVKSFLRTGQRSPDEIYILQQWIEIPAVVRLEFSFGRLLYGLEVQNVNSSTAMAPCGCYPQFNATMSNQMCSALFRQGSGSLSNRLLTNSPAAATGLVAGGLLSWLVGRGTDDKIMTRLLAGGLGGAVLLTVARELASRPPTPSVQPNGAPQNPIRLLSPASLFTEYPVLSSVPEKVKHMMSDLGAATMALDIALVGSRVMVLDVNIHTNYGTEREKQHNLAFEDTGVGSVCLGLSSLMRGLKQSEDFDLPQMPSDNLVFGIGLPRTGTHSLAEALKVLGFRGRHNNVLGIRHGQYNPNARRFAGYFHVDSSHFRRYEQLFTSHPNARFILTTRLDDEWRERVEAQHGGDVPEDMPSPNQYLSEVLRFFVNHHATHRLMVCNLFSESDELLWNKLVSFLPLSQKIDTRDQLFPKIIEDASGRLSKAVKVKKSASQQLIAEFKLMQDNDQSHDGRSEPDHSDTTSQSDFGGDLMSSKAKRVLNSYLDYKKSYKAKYVIRPDNADVAKLQVLDNTRLTPKDYDRNIFHLAMRVEGTQLATYDAGDCIGIYPENPREKVEHFITGMGFDGTELLELDSFFAGAEDGVYVMSVSQICMEYLDLFGPPSKSFYLELSKYAEDIVQKEQLAELSLDRKDAAYRARGLLAVTHASTLLEFSSLKLTAMNMLDLVPFTKPRLYSIASSRHKHPGEVHLLAVEHDWENSKGERCVGLSTYYMDKLRPNGAWHAGGDVVASLVRSPVLKLPKDSKAPVVMAGMGTGLAPFRAFIEERSVMKKKGQSIGNMRLYFGARHKKGEFLYRNELEAYEAQGWLKLRCAWSRDQKHKIYVQNLIAEDDEEIWEALKPQVNGSFYICGPIAPLEDIKKAITDIFKNHGLDGKYLDEMEATGRFATEVY